MRCEGPGSRLARLVDFLEQEEVEPDIHGKLHELQLRQGLLLQELGFIDQTDNIKDSLPNNDRDLEDFFSASHMYNQYLGQPRVVQSTQQRSKSVRMHHDSPITVPQPFRMSLRNTQRKGKEKVLDLWDTLELQNKEDPECLKQFRAEPVPARVLLPLYSDLVEEQEAKRNSAVEKRKEFLLATQKPFQFISKEEEKRKQAMERHVPAPSHKVQHIKRTIPKSVLDPSVSDKLKEAELVRKIKSQMRAKDMLEKSSAPIALSRSLRDPGSSISLKTQQECLAYLEQNLTFQPHINPSVPDFQQLYRKFQKESLSNYKERGPTRNKPFTLRTSTLRVRKKHTLEDVEDIHSKSKTSSTYLHGLASLSLNTLPVYITDSTKKRESAIRSSLEEKAKQETEKTERMKKKETQAMRKSISSRAKALDPHQPLADTNVERRKHIRDSDMKRMKEYKEELEDMKARVKARPYLFEHVTKGNAVKEADRRFTRTLQQAGLTEEFVQHQGKGISRKENQEEEEEAWEED
ncbi:protein FAM161B [Pelobates fuscus]|uniref:protein FAM161B n=1 Tax=Pelobates fuscus TaxID=191477 RepID=UPI002FE4843C